jgi:hypothetical protein
MQTILQIHIWAYILTPAACIFLPAGGKLESTSRYTQERKEIIDKMHSDGFLSEAELDLVHHFMMVNEEKFAWQDSERGTFKEEFFPPVRMALQPGHKVWVERNIPIPPGQLEAKMVGLQPHNHHEGVLS